MSGPDGHLAAPSERELFRRLQTLDEMLRASEAAEERFRRAAAAREQERRRIPPVPDLRFEYSYTRSVAPYVHLERPAGDKGKERAVGAGEEGEEEEGGEGRVGHEVAGAEIMRVQWGRVLWITMRDQVISLFLQGALWCVYYLCAVCCGVDFCPGVSRAISCDPSARCSGSAYAPGGLVAGARARRKATSHSGYVAR